MVVISDVCDCFKPKNKSNFKDYECHDCVYFDEKDYECTFDDGEYEEDED